MKQIFFWGGYFVFVLFFKLQDFLPWEFLAKKIALKAKGKKEMYIASIWPRIVTSLNVVSLMSRKECRAFWRPQDTSVHVPTRITSQTSLRDSGLPNSILYPS